MNGESRCSMHDCILEPTLPRVDTYPSRESTTGAAAAEASPVRQVIDAVGRCISFDTAEFPNEFFPAHLSIAVVEAVFRFQPRQGEQSSLVAKRYCRHFGLAHSRRNKFMLPPVDEQETLADLIGHYDEKGVEGMANEVFETSCRLPGTELSRSEVVVRIAKTLRHVGLDVLQDVPCGPAQEIEEALRGVPGVDAIMARLLMTYAGDDDFVVGDGHVRRFVAEAIGQRTVPAIWANHLVRLAAYELVLSPRYLDHRIRRHVCGKSASLDLRMET